MPTFDPARFCREYVEAQEKLRAAGVVIVPATPSDERAIPALQDGRVWFRVIRLGGETP